jgi:hypothetical protein
MRGTVTPGTDRTALRSFSVQSRPRGLHRVLGHRVHPCRRYARLESGGQAARRTQIPPDPPMHRRPVHYDAGPWADGGCSDGPRRVARTYLPSRENA